MTERPILFKSEMVNAILDGHKTQTRRIIKPHPTWDGKWFSWSGHAPNSKYGAYSSSTLEFVSHFMSSSCLKGKVGDRLWVRETLKRLSSGLDVMYEDNEDYDIATKNLGWKTIPSIHTFRHESRIDLEIIDIRVERLQEITNEDARQEGTPYASPHRHGQEGIDYEESPGVVIADKYAEKHNTGWNDCWICTFRQLWQSINGIKSWNSNPWVWVISFKRIV